MYREALSCSTTTPAVRILLSIHIAGFLHFFCKFPSQFKLNLLDSGQWTGLTLAMLQPCPNAFFGRSIVHVSDTFRLRGMRIVAACKVWKNGHSPYLKIEMVVSRRPTFRPLHIHRFVSDTPATTNTPPMIIDIRTGSCRNSALRAMPNTGTRLLKMAVRDGPIAIMAS